MNIIEQIHHEFKTAYLETFRIASDNTKDVFQDNLDYEKAISLGFSKSPSILKYQIEKVKYEENKDLLNQIKRFKIDYPLKKFITFKDAADILFKYNLVIAKPDKFIGDFPDKNIKDLANFELKEEDIRIFTKDCCDLYQTYESPEKRYNMFYNTQESFPLDFCFDRNSIVKFVRQIDSALENRVELLGQRINIEDYFISSSKNGYSIFKEEKFRSDRLLFSNKDKFLIIGTPDQFDIRSNERVSNGKIDALKDDPIIVKPVKHGFIIVTAWGDEAQLDEIKDVNLN